MTRPLLNNDFNNIGITVHELTNKIDNGAIFIRKKIRLVKTLNINHLKLLSFKISTIAIDLFIDILINNMNFPGQFFKTDDSILIQRKDIKQNDELKLKQNYKIAKRKFIF